MTRAWTRSCAACSVRKGLIFLMLYSANLQDRAVFAMCSLKVSWSSKIKPRFLTEEIESLEHRWQSVTHHCMLQQLPVRNASLHSLPTLLKMFSQVTSSISSASSQQWQPRSTPPINISNISNALHSSTLRSWSCKQSAHLPSWRSWPALVNVKVSQASQNVKRAAASYRGKRA